MKTVHELNQNELQELRSSWYHQHLDDGSLNEVMGIEEDEEIEEEQIPMDVIIDYYGTVGFVEEDFFCNLKD